MKSFMIEYTEDFGATHQRVLVCAANSSEAYVTINIKLPEDGSITDIFEIE